MINKPDTVNTDDTITSEVQPADKPKQSDITLSNKPDMGILMIQSQMSCNLLTNPNNQVLQNQAILQL